MIEKYFDKSKYKAVAFDLDGTLLNNGEVSQYTLQVLEKLKKHDIHIIISTGRAFSIIPNSIKQLQVVEFIVSSSGACVTDVSNGNVLFKDIMESQVALDVINILKKFGGTFFVVNSDLAILTPRFLLHAMRKARKKELEKVTDELKEKTKITLNLKKLIKNKSLYIEKMNCLFKDRNKCRLALDELVSEMAVEAVTTMGEDIEITSKGIDKAKGLQEICNAIGIRIEQIVAFGDSQNDISMFKSCGYSVVMANATEEVKAFGDYIAYDASNDGAANAVKDLFELD